MPDQLERLKAASHKVAQLVLIDRVYVPIFERLELEIAAREHEEEMIARAEKIARDHSPD
jgi:thioesterase domain-containing protein